MQLPVTVELDELRQWVIKRSGPPIVKGIQNLYQALDRAVRECGEPTDDESLFTQEMLSRARELKCGTCECWSSCPGRTVGTCKLEPPETDGARPETRFDDYCLQWMPRAGVLAFDTAKDGTDKTTVTEVEFDADGIKQVNSW